MHRSFPYADMSRNSKSSKEIYMNADGMLVVEESKLMCPDDGSGIGPMQASTQVVMSGGGGASMERKRKLEMLEIGSNSKKHGTVDVTDFVRNKVWQRNSREMNIIHGVTTIPTKHAYEREVDAGQVQGDHEEDKDNDDEKPQDGPTNQPQQQFLFRMHPESRILRSPRIPRNAAMHINPFRAPTVSPSFHESRFIPQENDTKQQSRIMNQHQASRQAQNEMGARLPLLQAEMLDDPHGQSPECKRRKSRFFD